MASKVATLELRLSQEVSNDQNGRKYFASYSTWLISDGYLVRRRRQCGFRSALIAPVLAGGAGMTEPRRFPFAAWPV